MTEIVGGHGGRWRGRSIRPIFKDGSSCASMPNKDSMIMSPCNVECDSVYQVSVCASKNGGNGILLVNFFGGQNYDGAPATVNITTQNISTYKATIRSPKFPKGLPISLRIWKPSSSTGNVYVKLIKIDKVVVSAQIQQQSRPIINTIPKVPPALIKREEPKKVKRERKEIIVRPKKKQVAIVKEKKKPSINKFSDLLSFDTSLVPLVSIITPTRDGRNLVESCYKAIKENTIYPNWEWIIGDSNSQDGTAELIKSWQDPRIKLVERKTTEGSFSSINNELVKYSTGEYLLFLNDDTQPQFLWLYTMVSKLHNRENIGVVGARLLYLENKIQHAGVAFIPHGPVNVGKSVLKSLPQDFPNNDRFYQAVTGACMLVRKTDFLAVGGFDEGYYFCYEDIDLCLKINKQLNKKIVYASSAKVYHRESATQKKFGTACEKQRNGIALFRARWSSFVRSDLVEFSGNPNADIKKTDISFVTCVSNLNQYKSHVLMSLLKNTTKKNYEVIPVLNAGNKYSAAQALNIGIKSAKGNIIVLCHQDVVFFEKWIDNLFIRIAEVEGKTSKWGVLGTAGINSSDTTIGRVYNIKGKLSWASTTDKTIMPAQTVDEHCMVIKKNSGLLFDEKTVKGFHFYGADICLNASINKGLVNYGILCPIIHNSASGSLNIGKKEFERLMVVFAEKWKKVPVIRTPTSLINRKSKKTFLKFKKR